MVSVKGKVIGVERGNVELRDTEKPVCAFSVDTGAEYKVKVLLKYDEAKVIWNNFLKDGGTINRVVPASENPRFLVKRDVEVSLNGEVRDVREGELVLHNPTDIVFDYKFTIGKVE